MQGDSLRPQVASRMESRRLRVSRIGMHLIFYGHEQTEILETKRVENLLRAQSIKVIFLATDHFLFLNQCGVFLLPNISYT